MQINKKATALSLLSAGVIIGTAGVIALQTHAQQTTAPTSSTQTTISAQTPATTTNNTQSQQDNDNIQDPGGIEKPDTPEKVQGADVQEDQGNDKDTTPDNGKDDANESPNSAD